MFTLSAKIAVLKKIERTPCAETEWIHRLVTATSDIWNVVPMPKEK
jgi:hypothetical protein